MQYECPAANCSTPQDRRHWMLGSRDVVWYEGRPGLHEPRGAERVETVCDFYVSPGQTGRQRHYVCYLSVHACACLSIHLFVHLLPNCEHDSLKMSEPILMPIGTSDPRGKGDWRWWSGGLRSKSPELEKIDLEFWMLGGGIIFSPRESSSFSSLYNVCHSVKCALVGNRNCINMCM